MNYIRDMLSKNRSLKFLDLSRNALGFQSIQKLQSCGCAKHLHMNVEGESAVAAAGGQAYPYMRHLITVLSQFDGRYLARGVAHHCARLSVCQATMYLKRS